MRVELNNSSKKSRPDIMVITDAAIERVKELLSDVEDENVIGIRVDLRAGGCSGYKYVIDYATDIKKHEEVIVKDGISIIISGMATMYILGSEMDYVAGKFENGFQFNNPQEKARCGCGESISF